MLSNQKHRDPNPNPNPNNADLRLHYCETLKLYKHTLRLKKEQYYKQQLTLIEEALKSKKACGPDGIFNEMLKPLNNKFQSAILKLFNLALSVGYFPDIWNQGLITPVYKNGDKFDPNNYRGICVNSNLGKIFCSIINDF